jgi:hypothetical protein
MLILWFEQARNLTVPECDEAQNHTVPPPKRPENFGSQQTLGYKLARRLVPYINGSHEFELLISKTDETCGLEDDIRNITTCSEYSPWPTPLQEPSSSAHDLRRRSFDFNLTFPLPSPELRNFISPPHVPGKFLFWFIAINVCISLYIFVPVYGFYRNRPSVFGSFLLRHGSRAWLYFFFAYSTCSHMESILGARIIHLAVWIAQDTFLESCLATHVSHLFLTFSRDLI